MANITDFPDNSHENDVSMAGPIRDEGLDVASLMGILPEDEVEEESDAPTILTTGDVIDEMLDDPEEDEENNEEMVEETSTRSSENTISPLEQMKLNRENSTRGMVVNNEDIESAKDKDIPKNIVVDTLEKAKELAISDLDGTIEKRKMVVLTKNVDPSNRLAVAELMDEIESVVIKGDGTAEIKYMGVDGKPARPKYIRLRTAADPSWEEEQRIFEYMKQKGANGNPEDEKKMEDAGDINMGTSIDEIKEEKKNQTVEIIIDKTGFGADLFFTEEEKDKLRTADEILLKTIELKDVSVLTTKRSTKPFSEHIHQSVVSGGATTVPFPASGFRGQIGALNYAELTDFLASTDTVTYDAQKKKFTIVYNKLRNCSCGKFESFDDFLHKFSFVDMELAVYGILVATFPEDNTCGMKCGARKCQRNYTHTYQPRSIISLKDFSQEALDIIEQLGHANELEARRLAANAIVRKSKFIQLPGSKYIVEVGVASAYQYLNNVVPALDDEFTKERYPEYGKENVLMLPFVLSFQIPDSIDEDGNPVGEYTLYDSYTDLLDIIDTLPMGDTQTILSCVQYYSETYSPVFKLKNVKCPHCGHVTKEVTVDPTSLVFQMYRHQINTTVNVSSVLAL